MEQALSPDMLAIAIDHYLVKKGVSHKNNRIEPHSNILLILSEK